jgi:hypothetical protein
LRPENPLFVFSFLEEEHVRFGFWRELKRRDRDRDGESSVLLVHCFVFELVRKGRLRALSVFEVGRLSVCLLVGTKGFLL